MRRNKCVIEGFELSFPIAAFTDIISKPEQLQQVKQHWKGYCLDTEKSCYLNIQFLEDKSIVKICVVNLNTIINGNRLYCNISNLELTSQQAETPEILDHQTGVCTSENSVNLLSSENENKDNIKRKRGRPKGSKKVNKYDNVHHPSEMTTVEVETKRYGLRGVKISEAVMRAEMGSLYKEKTPIRNTEQNTGVDISEYQNQSDSTLTETNTEIQVCKTQEVNSSTENCNLNSGVIKDGNTSHDEIKKSNIESLDDDYKDPDYIDDDYVGYISDDEDFIESMDKRKFGSVGRNGRKRNKIDIGNIVVPKYKKIEFNKNKGCKYCRKHFYHYVGVEVHVRKYHMKETDVQTYLDELKNLRVEKCGICNKTFNNRYHLIEHEKRSHLENASVNCVRCGKVYKNVQSLKNHIRAVHNVIGQPFACHLCPAKFKWSTTLKQHIDEIHECKMNVVCKHCGKRFSRQNLLNRHMRIHETDMSKRLICKTCGRGFWYEHNLQRHIKIIHGPHEEKFHCSYCGKGFSMKSAMVTHVQQVHFNIFPFKCNECSVGFKRSKLYQLHMVKEHNILDVNTLKTNGRQRFKYGKTEEDLFYCSHCSLSFCYKTKMVEHMHSAHGEDFPYMCKHCNQGFLEKSFLSHHLSKAHNEIVSADETLEEERNRFQMVTIDINGQKKDLEVESFNLPQPVVIEKTEEVENIVNVEVNEKQNLSGEESTQSLFFEVSKGEDTIHYVIEQSANGDPTILPQELADLLLAAEQSLNEQGTSKIQLIPQETVVDADTDMISVRSLDLRDNDVSVTENI